MDVNRASYREMWPALPVDVAEGHRYALGVRRIHVLGYLARKVYRR
jgi:hypothetical protein